MTPVATPLTPPTGSPNGRKDHVTGPDGRIYIMGTDLIVYDPATQTWFEQVGADTRGVAFQEASCTWLTTDDMSTGDISRFQLSDDSPFTHPATGAATIDNGSVYRSHVFVTSPF